MAHFFIFEQSNLRQHFNDGHFTAVRSSDGGKFKTGGTGSDDHHRFGKFLLSNGFAVPDHFSAFLDAVHIHTDDQIDLFR